ncbi:MAG: hypothetical protein ACMXYM_01835 [Candidatus Woesearchaeota archaeon]
MTSAFDRAHTRRLTLLKSNPLWIGIDGTLDTRVEVPVTGPTGDRVGDIDLLVRTASRIIAVEYKLAYEPKHEHTRRRSALSQLDRIDRRFAAVFGWSPDLVYAFGIPFAYEHVRSGSRFESAPALADIARALGASDGFLNGGRRLS